MPVRVPAEGRPAGDVGSEEITKVIQALAKQKDATKTIYFHHRGVVTDSRTVPDHDIQLRALNEVCKLLDLYPKPGDRRSARHSGQTRPLEIRIYI